MDYENGRWRSTVLFIPARGWCGEVTVILEVRGVYAAET